MTVKVKEVPGIRKEIGIIPAWAFVLAVAVFFVIPFVFFKFSGVWSAESNAPFVFRALISFLPGTMLAFLALMAGYVNRDAGRRGMSRSLWTFLVLILPNAIAFILYFLLRTPIHP